MTIANKIRRFLDYIVFILYNFSENISKYGLLNKQNEFINDTIQYFQNKNTEEQNKNVKLIIDGKEIVISRDYRIFENNKMIAGIHGKTIITYVSGEKMAETQIWLNNHKEEIFNAYVSIGNYSSVEIIVVNTKF